MSEQRRRFVGFLQGAEGAPRARAAIINALKGGRSTKVTYDVSTETARGISLNTIPNSSIDHDLPHWISVYGINSMVMKLSSPSVWDNLVAISPSTIQDKLKIELGAHYLQTADRPPHVRSHRGMRRRSIAEELTINNSQFLTSALRMGLLAVAFGQSIEEYVYKDAGRSHSTEFALAIGRKYGKPPKDEKEYMDRVLELLPDPDKTDAQTEGTLLHFLMTSSTFNKLGDSDKRCPAVELTRIFLEEWGRQLHQNPDYRARFEGEIFQTSSPVSE